MHKKKSKNFIFILFLLFSCYYVIYCQYLMIELPILSWFNQMPLAKKYLDRSLQIKDLFTRYAEHGMLGTNLLFLLNVEFFHMTTMFDVYINNINVIISAIIFILGVKITVSERNKSWYLGFISICLFMFSITQYSSGGMETQVRLGILLFLITMIFIDREIRESRNSFKHTLMTLLLIFISINVFGSLYSFAGIPLVFLIIAVLFAKKRTIIKKHLLICVTYLISIIFYILSYNLFTQKAINSTGIASGLIDIFLHPFRFLHSFISLCANAVLGWSYTQSAEFNIYIWNGVGFMVALTVIAAIIMFFRCKMYQKTYFPLMSIVYNIGVFVLVYIGRGEFDWRWFGNAWYTVHTKIMLAGVIWIIMFFAQTYNTKNKVMKIYFSNTLIILLSIGIVFGNLFGLQRVPHERNYYLEKQPYLFASSIEKLPVDSNGNTPLLESPELTMEAINIMKDYGLSVYKYWSIYEKSMQIMQ